MGIAVLALISDGGLVAEEDLEAAQAEPLESLLARVPRDKDGQPLSIGSLRHADGDCRPCAYFGNAQRPCLNGIRCTFCHFSHSPKRRVQLCRRKRIEMRTAVANAVAEAGPEGLAPPPKYVPIAWSGKAAAGRTGMGC